MSTTQHHPQAPHHQPPKPTYILDSHVHLWPTSVANSEAHSWMGPDNPLTRPYILDDYVAAASPAANLHASSETELEPEHDSTASTSPHAIGDAVINTVTSNVAESTRDSSRTRRSKHLGIIYIETDRTLLPSSDPLTRYTHPLHELTLLRSFITSHPHSKLIRAIVPFGPIDEGPTGLERYIPLARSAAGPETWSRVVGFRFLVQGIHDEGEFRRLEEGEKWVRALVWLGREGRKWRTAGQENGGEEVEGGRTGFSFDIGVDQRQGGSWQLEAMAGCVERVRRLEDEEATPTMEHAEEQGKALDVPRTTFILNHFCKPAFSLPDSSEFKAWHAAMARFAAQPAVYLKLSGFLTELSSPITVPDSFNLIIPYIRAAFDLFGARRIMWGSDWPVCNIGLGGSGQHGGSGHWREWREFVERVMEEMDVRVEDSEWVWWRTAVTAYGVDLDAGEYGVGVGE